MKARIISILFMGVMAGGALHALAAFPLYDGFESYPAGVSLNGSNGWVAADAGFAAQGAIVAIGNQAAALPPSATVSNAIPAATNVWIDFYVTNAAPAVAGSFTEEDVDTNLTVMWYVATNGCPVVWHPVSKAWLVCSNDYWGTAITNFSTNAWMRFTLYENYSYKTAALFLDQHLLREGIRFINTNLTESVLFGIIGGYNATSYFDEVSARYVPTNMTLDVDNDGVLDANEFQSYGNVDVARRLALTLAVTNQTEGGAGGGWASNPATNLVSLLWMEEGTNLQFSASNGYYAAEILTNGTSVGMFDGIDTNYANYSFANHQLDATVTVAFARMPAITTSSIYHNGPGGSYGTVTVSTNRVYPNRQVTVSLTAGVAYAVSAVNTNGAQAVSFGDQPVITNWVITGIRADMAIEGVFTYTATRTVPGNYGTLQEAMAFSQTGDTIVVSSSSPGVVFSNDVSVVATNVAITGGLVVGAGTTGTLTRCSNLSADTTTVSGILIISNGTVNLGTVTVVGTGEIRLVDATSVVINGATLCGSQTIDALWGVLKAQVPPFHDDFERYGIGVKLSSQGTYGWSADSVGVVVESNTVCQEAKAAILPVNAVLSNSLAPAACSNIWVSWNLHDAGRINETTVELEPRWTNSALVLFLNTSGYVTVYDAQSSSFNVLSNDIAGNEVKVGVADWPRVIMNLNYLNRMAAVFLNGHLLRQQLRYVNTNQANCVRLAWEAGSSVPAYLDDVGVWTNAPSELLLESGNTHGDLDGDGTSDALEIQQHGSTVLYPRGSVFKIR